MRTRATFPLIFRDAQEKIFLSLLLHHPEEYNPFPFSLRSMQLIFPCTFFSVSCKRCVIAIYLLFIFVECRYNFHDEKEHSKVSSFSSYNINYIPPLPQTEHQFLCTRRPPVARTEHRSKVGGNNTTKQKENACEIQHESFYASLQAGRNKIPSCHSPRANDLIDR